MDFLLPTIVVALIGLIGVISALAAWQQLQAEIPQLERLKAFFRNGQGPLNSLSLDKLYTTSAAEWLKDNEIAQESHAADHLLAVWGGWLASRLPTLSELHSLSARRERARGTARYSGGIATVLLVCGVAGTLAAIHPVLSQFTIQVDANGAVQDASKSAENVMNMIHQLSNSFWPSIAAITFTLLIVFARSGYHRAAFHLGRELDRFTVDSLLPAFRLRTVGEEFTDTQVRLGSLADSIERRDQDFAEAVKTLPEIIKEMRDAGSELRGAAKQVATAAARLSTEATGIINGLATHFGENGALVRSVSGFKQSVDRNQEAAKTLSSASRKLEDTTKTLADAVQYLPGALEKGCVSAIDQFTDRANKSVNEAGRDMVAAVDRAAAPLEESVAKIQGASRAMQASGQAAKAEIAMVLGEGKAALDAAVVQIQSNAEAAASRLAQSFEEGVRGPLDESIARLASTQEEASGSLQALAAFAAQIVRSPQPEPLDAAANHLYEGAEPSATVSRDLEPVTIEEPAVSEADVKKPWYRF